MATLKPTKNLLLVALLSFLLNGCIGGNANVRPDAKSGHVSVGKVNHSDMASVQQQIETLLQGEGIQTATQRRVEWSRLLRSYTSQNDQFELAIMTAMALDQLAEDQRHAFLRTAGRIRDRIDQDTALAPETELVLALAQAMGEAGDTPYNPNPDKGRITLAVERLLGE
ncbi:MAG: hypothetical protein JAZ15_03125 [Candidatus Thiodiazotropha endolucinida]|nr:hypothetical protein [Candidatus Thiodiazotropha taylori]MCW4311987.1 hypothetical protein [Candidatus Thiodiazotropha taylori]